MNKTRLSVTDNSMDLAGLKALAQKHGNCSLTLVPRHKNLYRDYAEKTVRDMEKKARESLKASVIDLPVAAILSTDQNIRERISTTHQETISQRGDVSRISIRDMAWFDENWPIFTGPFEFGSKRKIHLFLKFNSESLQTLVSNWYDPNVLTNPSIASSPRAIAEIKKQLKPGMMAFSITLIRLAGCQLYFHPSDMDSAVDVICNSAQKTEWWWQMLRNSAVLKV